jgi:hypothetical protein
MTNAAPRPDRQAAAPSRRVLLIAAALMAVAGSACGTGGTATTGLAHAARPQEPSPASGTRGVARGLAVQPSNLRLDAPLERAVSVVDHHVVIVAGGLDAAGRSSAAVRSVDRTSGRVRTLGSLPRAFHDAAGALLGRRLFVFGGGSTAGSDLVQSFDPADGRARVVGHLPVALSDLASASIGNTVYLVGGYDGAIPRREVYATSDGRHFRIAGRLPVGLRYAAVAPFGDEVIIAGGQDAHAEATSEVYALDTHTGTVSIVCRLPSPIAHASAFAAGSRVFVVGGRDRSGSPSRSVTSVDPRDGRRRSLPPLRRPVADAATAVTATSALLVGGARTAPLEQILIASPRFDPGAST